MKTKLLVVLTPIILATSPSRGGETIPSLVAGGKTYTNVTITAVTPSGIKVIHDAGAGVIPLSALPPEMQQKYGYDPAAAAQHAAAQKEQQQLAAASQKAQLDSMEKAQRASSDEATAPRIPVELRVLESDAGGSLCSWTQLTMSEDKRVYSVGRVISGKPPKVKREYMHEKLYVTGLPPVADGQEVPGFIARIETMTFTGRSRSPQTVFRCRYFTAAK